MRRNTDNNKDNPTHTAASTTTTTTTTSIVVAIKERKKNGESKKFMHRCSLLAACRGVAGQVVVRCPRAGAAAQRGRSPPQVLQVLERFRISRDVKSHLARHAVAADQHVYQRPPATPPDPEEEIPLSLPACWVLLIC